MQQFAWSGNRPPNASPAVICKCRGRLAPLHETRKRMEDPHFLPFPPSAPYPASRRRLQLRSFASRTRNRRPRIQEYADREREREKKKREKGSKKGLKALVRAPSPFRTFLLSSFFLSPPFLSFRIFFFYIYIYIYILYICTYTRIGARAYRLFRQINNSSRLHAL